MKHSLIPMYREMHADAHFSGISIYPYADQIAELVKRTGAQTLLDYGSGKGRQYIEGRVHLLWGGIRPTLYDPAVAALARRPEGQFDGVICTDVMEHIPEDEVDDTLADIRHYARMWAFFSICCTPAKKALPDGRNVHVTLRPQKWWLKKVSVAFENGPAALVEFQRASAKKPPPAQKVPKAERIRLGWQK